MNLQPVGVVFAVVLLAASSAGTHPPVQNAQTGAVQGTAPLRGLADSLAMITDLLDRGRGIEAENVARALLLRVESARGRDALEVAQVLDLLGRAVRRSNTVTNEQKAEFAERAVAIKEQVLGPWHPELALSLTNLAIQRTLAADPASAKTLLERAVTIRERAFGPDDASVADTLGSLAGVLMTLRDDLGAGAALERVLDIHESTYGAAHEKTIRTLFKIAVFDAEIADYVGARRRYERALSLAEKTLGATHPLVFDIRLRLAIVLSEGLGDYAGAAQLNERVVVEAERVFGAADPRLTVALRNLAFDRRDLGDYGSARALAERSLQIAERTFGPRHPDVASSLHSLATVLAAQGAYGEAMQAFERATEINDAVLRPADPELSRASWFIRDLVPVSGYSAEDAVLFEQTIAARERSVGLADPHAADSLTNLAAILSSTEDCRRTRPLFERGLAAQERAHGPDHPDVAVALSNLARLVAQAGDTAAARPLYARALGIWERARAPNPTKVAAALFNLATVESTSGDDRAARALLTRALALQEQHLGPAHPDVADTLSSVSLLELRAGATADAFATAARANDIRREHLRLTVRTLAERQALAYASTAASALDVMLSIAASGHADEQTTAAWNAVLRSRGLVLEEMAARQRAASVTEDAEIVDLTKTLAAARQRLAAAVVRGIRHDPPERYRRLLEQTRSDKDRAERELAAKSARFRDDQASSRVTVADLSSSLAAESAVVGFVSYHRHGPAAAERTAAQPLEGERSYLAFVLRAGDRVPAVVPLGEAATIDALVARWQGQINQEALAGGRATVRGEAAYRRVASELRSRVWDPLLPSLASASRVFIIPDGALHLVSFAALPSTASRYLVETGPLIHYLSAERDLMAGGKAPTSGGLLALGSPDFDEANVRLSAEPSLRSARSGCIDLQSMRFDPLPASLDEVNEVVTLWNRSGGDTLRLVGAAASEAAFKSEAGGHRVLHLATHGFFLGRRCGSAMKAPDTGRSATVTRDSPLLLSGLILAGANQRDAAAVGQEDGVLTAEEVVALNLSGVDWAVLSGCDTGVGEIRAGEGVFGLRRAFQVAGAKTVIMSLWTVEDQSTQQWMATLYSNRLARNLSTAEAVREASRTVLRQRRDSGVSAHPFYWAAFVAAGDWR